MKYIYFDASSGLSGDMILGALLDLGVAPSLFKKKMAELKLPVDIQTHLRYARVPSHGCLLRLAIHCRTVSSPAGDSLSWH